MMNKLLVCIKLVVLNQDHNFKITISSQIHNFRDDEDQISHFHFLTCACNLLTITFYKITFHFFMYQCFFEYHAITSNN